MLSLFTSSSNINFKKFFARLFIYLIIIIAFVLAINYLYVKFNFYEPDDDTEKFQRVPYNIQVFNFGPSHTQNGINYSASDSAKNYTCFNFALSSQTLSYDLRLLKYYYDHLAKGGTCFIDISYFSLFRIPEHEREEFKSKNKRYYKFLDAKSIKQYDFWTGIFVKYLPALAAYDKLFKRETKNKQPETAENLDLAKNGLARWEYHVIKDNFDSNGNRIYNQEEIDALYEMIKLLKLKNITPVLITTPYMSEYPDTVQEKSPEFFDEFYGLINKICDETGIKYYDYSRDARFQDEHERLKIFRDADHLNKAGAAKFTEIIFKEIINKN